MDQEAKDRLVEALELNTKAIQRHARLISDWKHLLFRGVLIGFGGVIGATIVVSVVVNVLQPFKSFETLEPSIDRLTRELSRE
jgi:hypothetical protein